MNKKTDKIAMLRRLLQTTLIFAACLVLLTGCDLYEIKEDGDDLTYDICDDTMLPEELLSVINSKKEDAFNLTYSNNTYTYIVICSGKQTRDDVGIVIEKMYMDENAIYVEWVIRQTATPSDASTGDTVSFPYIVLRIARTSTPVVFNN